MDDVNRCIICGVDMGYCNPRQLCCKTYCPEQFNHPGGEESPLNPPDSVGVPSLPLSEREDSSEKGTTAKRSSGVEGALRASCPGRKGGEVPLGEVSLIEQVLSGEVFTSMEISPYFIFGDSEPHLTFLRGVVDHLSLIPGDPMIIELDQQPIIRDDGTSWIFYRYPFSTPGTALYQWNMIIVNLLSDETHTWWIRNQDMMTITLKK